MKYRDAILFLGFFIFNSEVYVDSGKFSLDEMKKR